MNGYCGTLLYVDLTHSSLRDQPLDPAFARKWIGGSGFGARLLYEQVQQDVAWDDPRNRMVIASGPLGATRVNGTGLFSAVFKGPMTHMAGTSQAVGFMGAFLRLCGYDGIVIDGASESWKYLLIQDGRAELCDATPLLGLDTWETHSAIAAQLGLPENKVSVFSIGPAGEHLVRFAGIIGDKGHAAPHNGSGAVLGAKKLKAIAVVRGAHKIPIADPTRLSEAVAQLTKKAVNAYNGQLSAYGTGGGLTGHYLLGQLPIKNYTTSQFPEYTNVTGEYLRTHYKIKSHACWACQVAHVKMVEVTEGPYEGYQGEEPEYECIAALGPQIGNTELGSIVMLSNLIDRLGMDTNEMGWLLGWAMECVEKGLLKPADLDGLDLSWGNVPAVEQVIRKIATREGCGAWLAEGVMRAAAHIGGQAQEMSIHTLTGATPRDHDHRGRWEELLDTCLSNTGTIEAIPSLLGDSPDSPRLSHTYDPEIIVNANVASGGWRQFTDCLGICRFTVPDYVLGMEVFNAITGFEFSTQDALDVGRRTINQLRAFNFRHGLDPDKETPSPRYGSIPKDGYAVGKNFLAHFPQMKASYWQKMGWDSQTGKPLPQTLESLDLPDLIPELWGLEGGANSSGENNS